MTRSKEATQLTSRDSPEILARVLDRVRALDPAAGRKWFEDLALIGLDGGLLQIGCPDETTAQYLHDHCLSVFTQAAQNVTGHLVTVRFTVAGDRRLLVQPAGPMLRLHPDYTFDNFVVGPCNRLAHASCIAVSHSPGTTYNPLFLYGSVGLGKTHMLHAVCHETRKTFPQALIQFLSCEEFVNSFISAIEHGSLADFQGRLRSVDLLVIDDIQFLRQREQSQEEFFHTFNALYNAHKQIILTADCHPSELPALEERLVSRFKWGLVARLDAPSYETRVAIVQKKAHLRGLDVSETVAEYVAQRVTANIRELEGALTAIHALAQTSGLPITPAVARRALGDVTEPGERPITITDIINTVTKHFGVRPADLQSRKRSQSIALPRQVCMYLARNLTRYSLEEIGGHLGGRDHSTVLHACNKIDELCRSDPATQARLAELTDTLRRF